MSFKYSNFKLIASVSFLLLFISSCAITPTPDSSWVSIPDEGKSGVYFYQWKSGILGALYDVSLYLDGEKLGEINTGEYLYFEIPAGKHEYDLNAGQLLSNNIPVDFEAGNNYFFRGTIAFGNASVVLIKDPKEIKDAANNIDSGRYEHGNVDR